MGRFRHVQMDKALDAGEDLSSALDALPAHPAFADHIVTSRIMAAASSYVGWTALSMGSMTGNHARIIEVCTANIDDM